jgi:hypothetical protein
VTVCPWALREGILLRRLESAEGWHRYAAPLPIPAPRSADAPAEPAKAAVLSMDLARTGRAGTARLDPEADPIAAPRTGPSPTS